MSNGLPNCPTCKGTGVNPNAKLSLPKWRPPTRMEREYGYAGIVQCGCVLQADLHRHLAVIAGDEAIESPVAGKAARNVYLTVRNKVDANAHFKAALMHQWNAGDRGFTYKILTDSQLMDTVMPNTERDHSIGQFTGFKFLCLITGNATQSTTGNYVSALINERMLANLPTWIVDTRFNRLRKDAPLNRSWNEEVEDLLSKFEAVEIQRGASVPTERDIQSRLGRG